MAEDFSGVALLVEAIPGNLKAWLNLSKTDKCSSPLFSLPSSLILGLEAKQTTKGYDSSRFLQQGGCNSQLEMIVKTNRLPLYYVVRK